MALRAGAIGLGGVGNNSLHIELVGISDLINTLRIAETKLKESLHEALLDEARDILDRATDLVPVATARLMQSGRIIKPPKNAVRPTFNVVYGGINIRGIQVDYALRVHEEPQEKRRTGESQFLAKAAAQVLPGATERIASKLRFK